MTTIFLPIITRQTSIKQLKNLVEGVSFSDISLHIACEKNNSLIQEFDKLKKNKKLPITLDIYPNGTKEDEMISYSFKSLPPQKILLVRDTCVNLSADNIEKLIAESILGSEIVMLTSNKKMGKTKTLIRATTIKLCKTFFNFKYYNGDIGMQLFNEQAHSIMKTTNLTLLSKLNKWVAITISYIPANITPTKIKTPIPTKTKIWTTIYTTLLIITTILIIILPIWVKIDFLGALIFIFAFIVEIALLLFKLLEIYNYKNLGNLYANNIEFIERRFI